MRNPSHKRRHIRSRARSTISGFTLIELLISVLLATIVVFAALSFFTTQHYAWLSQYNAADSQQRARVCLDKISDEMRMAGYGLPSGDAYRFVHDTLYIYMRDGAAVDTLAYFVHSVDSSLNVLVRRRNSEIPEAFVDGVDSLMVSTITPSLVTVSVAVSSLGHDNVIAVEDKKRKRLLETEIHLRNRTL
jgi:type II secretory pathway pseudopilin PulG